MQNMMKHSNQEVNSTQNPLIFVNMDDDLIFMNSSDLNKFSVKFKPLKDQYDMNKDHRMNCIEQMKEEYSQV